MVKWGLGNSYDDVSVLSKKTRAYLDICQPASTVGAMGATLMATLFYFLYTGDDIFTRDSLLRVVYVVVTMGLAHAASQALNQAEDAEMDADTPHKQNRPIPAGIIDEDEARSIAWILAAVALGRSYVVSTMFGMFTTVIVFFGVFYNLSPIRAKERIISIPWQAVSRGLLPYPAVWAAFGDPTSAMPWVIGVFMFFYVMGYQNTADIIDADADRRHGISTFVVEFGLERVVVISIGCSLLMLSTILLATGLGIIPERFLIMAITLPLCLVMSASMWTNRRKVSSTTGNHPAYIWYYVGMVVTVSIPALIEIVRRGL